MVDAQELFDVIGPRRQVKAYVFGHTHHWAIAERDGIHLINLPPVAYLFNPSDPNGWVDCQLRDDGMTLEMHALNKEHKAHGQRIELTWRAA